MPLFPVSAIPSASVDYEIDNSLRFNDDDSAYLSRTPSSAGNRKTWTWSGWVKRGSLGAVDPESLFTCGDSNARNSLYFEFNNDQINLGDYSTYWIWQKTTTAVYRDVSAWYHIVLEYDTTNATAEDRVKLYVNGVRETVFGTNINPSLNYEGFINTTTNPHNLSRINYPPTGGLNYLDGYLAEVNFIDGQALTPSSFGEFGDYGEFKPIEYTGTYGTNGFYLDFKTSGTLGNDANGSNNWTTNNISATDQMIDTPTNNFATLNRLQMSNNAASFFLSEGNIQLNSTNNSGYRNVSCTFSPEGKKGYFEVCTAYGTVNSAIAFEDVLQKPNYLSYSTNTYDLYRYLSYSGDLKNNVTSIQTALTPDNVLGDIAMVAFDFTGGNRNVWFGVGGVWGTRGTIGVPSTGAFPHLTTTELNLSKEYRLYFSVNNGADVVANFGQDSSFAGAKTAQGNQDSNEIGDFYYTPPSGFLALCTKNLPAPTVIPSEHFNTVLYTGNGSTQSITGVGFQPDFIWFKNRTGTNSHSVVDSVRGHSSPVFPNLTLVEQTSAQGKDVTSFNTDGFSIGAVEMSGSVNISGGSIVAWNWKAGGAGTSVAESGTGDGSINAHTYSANTSAGFSIVKYEGRGDEISGGSHTKVGHGLSVAPEMVIIKSRDNTRGWAVMSDPLTYANYHLRLDTTAAKSAALYVTSTAPDSTHFYVGDDGIVNAVSENYIAYCFHSVDGYSKVGSYSGNGSADGTFVHTGFRPVYVMFKNTSSSLFDWLVYDNKRDTYNPEKTRLSPNTTNADFDASSYYPIDFTANGYKIRGTHGTANTNGHTYIYIAFAEQPFKHSNAR
jgi:hypothetical protein